MVPLRWLNLLRRNGSIISDTTAQLGRYFHQNEATVFWLSIWDGFFKVSIYLPEKARAEVLGLPLAEKIGSPLADRVRQKIADTRQMGTRQAFFPLVFEVYSDEMIEAIYALADFRKRMK